MFLFNALLDCFFLFLSLLYHVLFGRFLEPNEVKVSVILSFFDGFGFFKALSSAASIMKTGSSPNLVIITTSLLHYFNHVALVFILFILTTLLIDLHQNQLGKKKKKKAGKKP